ncbi:hypothetical protein [Sphingomonas abietis]|uniref:Uncharacterized protein n=1 Tax=Sphingomonas abietis TaxID=3012344 RepID=A0ABY7NS21_9SPHN|nr:hypothetical protein [Sphingomonas abietis]WBO22296.1 hypothetical protein PBT88_19470 [Sphingomonas abietis]
MFTDSPMTPQEEAADIAWENYAAAVTEFSRQVKAGEAHDRLRTQHEATMQAETRWKRAYAAITEPTPPTMQVESGRLTCEAFLLLSAIGAFVAFFLPGLGANFWPVVITFAVVAALGGWSFHFLSRLGSYLGGRL